MIKRFISIFVVAALCLSLCSCSNTASNEAAPVIQLPEPSAAPLNMIMGEQIASKPVPVALHYAAGDGTSFSSITRSLMVSPGESIYEETIDALLYNAFSPDRMAFIPSQLQVSGVKYSEGIVTVDLSLDALNIQSEQEYLMLIASVSNTLLSMKGVKGVNLLIGGRCESVASLPVGTVSEMMSGITPTYAQYNAEKDYFIESETGTITRNVTMYFPDGNGNWFVPEMHEVTFESSDYASSIIRALSAGSNEHACAISVIPSGVDLLLSTPVTYVNSNGENVLEVNFSPTLLNYLALSDIEEWQLIGSVVLTLCTFIPELDAVRICIDGNPLTACNVGDETIAFPDGIIHRSDCDMYVGSTVELYVPNADGTLEEIERAVSINRAQSPLSLLYALLDDVLVREDNADIFVSDVYYDDILGVSVQNEVASVNLSANFYRQAQALDPSRERAVIYSMVNTLCTLDTISGVNFLIEGICADTFAGNIYLKSVLMPNPGIVRKDPVPESETTETP